MKFLKKSLLSLALSGLTFMSSCGAPSCQAMSDTCYAPTVLDYLFPSTNQVAETSPSFVYLLFSSKKFWIAAYFAGRWGYTFFKIYFKNYKDKQAYMKTLQENSCGEITKPVYIQRQEGPYWCWIATIQGIINKIKPGNGLSQEEIYELTHNGKKPAYFEFNRSNVNLDQPEEDDDSLQARYDKNYARVLAKISDKLNTGEKKLYSFQVFDMTEHTAEDYKKIMNLLIDTFGSCFGISDPVAANTTKMPHLVLLCDYDETMKKLTFEEPYYVNRYQLELDKFAQLCESGKLKGQQYGLDIEAPFCLAVIIGFTNDIDKSGHYTIDWVNGQPTLNKKLLNN